MSFRQMMQFQELKMQIITLYMNLRIFTWKEKYQDNGQFHSSSKWSILYDLQFRTGKYTLAYEKEIPIVLSSMLLFNFSCSLLVICKFSLSSP